MSGAVEAKGFKFKIGRYSFRIWKNGWEYSDGMYGTVFFFPWPKSQREYLFDKYLEKAQLEISWIVPKWLVYWCAMRLIAYATTGKYSNQVVPDLTAMEAVRRWRLQ